MPPLDQVLFLHDAGATTGPSVRAMAGRARLADLARRLLRQPLAGAFLRFLAVGGVGLSVDAAVFSLLDAGHMAPEVSRAVSLALATVVTWRLNRRHTFGASQRRAWVEAGRYGLVTLLAQGLSYGIFLGLVYEVPALPRLVSLLVGAGLAAIVGFTGHKLFAFSRPAAGSAQGAAASPLTNPGHAPGH